MRDFSWKYFAMTGDVESYLLFKEMNRPLDLAQEDYEEGWPDEESEDFSV